jgi:hypothetical protein
VSALLLSTVTLIQGSSVSQTGLRVPLMGLVAVDDDDDDDDDNNNNYCILRL